MSNTFFLVGIAPFDVMKKKKDLISQNCYSKGTN
jgi:hypothetical protein